MNEIDVSIIIVNYNTTDYLRKCLRSLQEFTIMVKMEIIVVDNNSPDREIEKYPSEFPDVRFFFQSSNNGFGTGCNIGAAKANGKYLTFVNPDIVFDSDCISGMFRYMESAPDTGVCSPVMKDFEGRLNYIYNYFPNYNWEFHEAVGTGNGKKIEDLLEVFKEDKNSGNVLQVDWVTGACLFIRRKVFEKSDGYDEDYFLYYEDTDLQYRVRKSGHKIVCLKDLEVKHYTNSSIKSDKGEDVYFFHISKSKLIYMYKHFSFFKRNIIRFFYITGILIRMMTLPFRGKFINKKEKRFRQYQRMMELYLSGYESILKSKLQDN